MAEKTDIEWCDGSWSPWGGCQAVSPACDHCYAEAMDKRFGKHWRWGPKGTRQPRSAAYWKVPERINAKAEKAGKRTSLFPSMCDPFDNHRTILPAWRTAFWALIRRTPHIDWLLLTKRPQNIPGMLPLDWGDGWPNVWLGCTIENGTEQERRAHALASVPSAITFWSVEPMLGPINLEPCDQPDWIICGGESGPGKRPMDLQWARSLRDQCADAGVPFFFKQVDKVQPIPAGLGWTAVTVSGYELTHAGRMLYCSHCPAP